MNSRLDLTAAQLRRAARLQEKINTLTGDLEAMLGGARGSDGATREGVVGGYRKGKRRLSASKKAKRAAIARAR